MSEPTVPSGEPAPEPTPEPAPEPAPGDVAGPRHAAVAAETARHPRRWFLTGAGLAVLSAGGGVAAAYAWPERAPVPAAPPPELTAAIVAEQALIADLDATTGGTADVRRVLVRARADHAAHLQALTALAAEYDSRLPASAAVGQPRTGAVLRAAEQRASAAAAQRAAALSGSATAPSTARLATILASISACEATHAELLE